MKSVLISNRPKWCGKICHEIGTDENGKPIYEKRIEVRKTAPKEVPFKAYIYMTKKKPYMLTFAGNGKMRVHNGMVIGEFICDKVYKIEPIFSFYDCYSGYDDSSDGSYFEDYSIDNERLKKTCLTQQDLCVYGNGNRLYGWHISNLKIYDKPKELSEFFVHKKVKGGCENCAYYRTPTLEYCQDCNSGKSPKKYLTRPPQSWCYVEELENEQRTAD